MITLDKDEKKMVIPSALGNFGNGSGGSGVTRQEVYEIVDSSLTIYDEGIQQEIGAVSAATSGFAADIQAVSGSVAGINEELSGITADIAELSGITSGIGEDITLLQTTVGNHTTDIQELSGSTEAIAGSFSAYTPTSGFSTINGSAITAGGNIVIEGGATSYYLNEMTQAELAALYTLLESEVGRPDTEGVLSANTINEKYSFFAGNTSPEPPYQEYVELQFNGFYFGRAVFGQTISRSDSSNGVINYLVWLLSDGTFERMERTQKDFPNKGTDTVGYFDSFDNYVVFNKTNNTFTDKDGNALSNGGGFGGSIYWFVMHPIEGNWGNGIPTVPFKVIDENGVGKMYYYASVEMETLSSSVTIDSVEYTEKFAFKYPDFTFSGYLNNTPQFANLTFTEAAAGGGAGLVHLNTLSGVTGETNVLYECDGEFFWWNPNSGYCAEWDGLPTSGRPDNVSGFSFALNYTEIPDGTVLLEYSYINANLPSRVIKNGDKLEVRYAVDNYETVRASGVTGETIIGRTSNGGSNKVIIVFNPYSIIFRSDSAIFLASFWDGATAGAHWEMATKPENERFAAQDSGVPYWDKSGKIIGKRYNFTPTNTYVNNSGYTNPASIVYSNTSRLPSHMFFPTVGGTAGQVLTSAGNAEPVWADMPSGGDYQVVSGLPATAQEGQMFYVPEHTITYSGITLDRGSVEENYIGNINGVVDAPAVYYSNGSFFWGWENDGALHYDSRGFYYQTDGTNGTFLVVPTIDGVSVTPVNGATTAATPDAASVDVPGATYIYKDGGFQTVEYSKKQYFINNMTSAQRAALWTEIVTLTNSGRTNLTQVLANYQFFLQASFDGQVWGEAYFLNFERDLVWIGGTRPSKASYPFKMVRNIVGINANGTIESNIQDELENPQIKPYNFSYPDNGKLRYDADNSKFVMTNWYDTGNTRDVDTTGCTAGIAISTHLDEFIDNGLRNEAADHYYVCTPQYEFSFIESGVAHSYTRPTIIGQDIATITVDGRSFSRKYTFIYMREDGTRQGLSFVADSNGYAANFTFVGPFM